MTSDRQLKRWFNSYNDRFFAGQLPADTVVYYDVVVGAYGDCDRIDDQFVIRIQPGLCGWQTLAKLTLIHEMAHVATWGKSKNPHGAAFDREIQRLMQFKAVRRLI